ncbi:DUF938 domain-containing protein [Phaeobacter sp.]|uniref:DUF938 domain-containing protein n=1 Tax=Phaeobacter sp. TaxID=1902409 RepID=UPI0025EA3389|nr:DUF938 domain-containing protein [Phaeobacter sp.]
MVLRSVPDTASVAAPAAADEPDKLFSPSAARNLAPIADVIASIAPPAGDPRPIALEIASGTGQHIVGFAARCPHLRWQPSEIDPRRRASIDAFAAESTFDIAPALHLDATDPTWPADFGRYDLITLCNLLHLISAAEAEMVIRNAAAHLAPQGRFMIYGPFMRDGQLTSEGDQTFHNALVAHDPEVGYKDVSTVADWLTQHGLQLEQTLELPANNLALVAVAPAAGQGD